MACEYWSSAQALVCCQSGAPFWVVMLPQLTSNPRLCSLLSETQMLSVFVLGPKFAISGTCRAWRIAGMSLSQIRPSSHLPTSQITDHGSNMLISADDLVKNLSAD